MRALHISGNWGTNIETVAWWEPERAGPLVPDDFVRHLQNLHVNWIGISVALHYDDSMDSTVERAYEPWRNVPTFKDDVLRQLIREFRALDMDVYVTLSFESHEAYSHPERPAERWALGDHGDADTGVPLGACAAGRLRHEMSPHPTR